MGGTLGTLSRIITGSPDQTVRSSIIITIIVGLATALVFALLTSGCGDQTVDVTQESKNCSQTVANITNNQNVFSGNKVIMGEQVCGECDCGNNTVNVIQDFSKIEGIMKTGFTAKHNEFVNVYIVAGVIVFLVIANFLLVCLVFSRQRRSPTVDENTYNYSRRPQNIKEPDIEI